MKKTMLALLLVIFNVAGLAQSFQANVGTGIDGVGQSRPIPEMGYTLDSKKNATFFWQDDFNAGVYDPRDTRWAGGIYGATPALAAQAMSNQMACDLAMGVTRHAVARWPQGRFPIDQLILAPGSNWEGTAQSDGGTNWFSTTNNHFMALAPASMTVTCSDGQSHTDSVGFTYVSHFTLTGCGLGGCTNQAGDTANYLVGGPGNTGLTMQSNGTFENIFVQNFGGAGITANSGASDAKFFHLRSINNIEWYYFGGYKGVQETPASPEVSATTTGSTGSVTLTWTAVSGAAGYVVYRGASPGAESVFYSATSNTFTDTGAAFTSGTVTNVNTSTLAVPGTITPTPSTTGGTLAAGTYYYRVTAYGVDGWHGSIECCGLDGMADWIETYGFFDSPTIFTYHHLTDFLGGGGDAHFDHVWAQLGQVGIAQPGGSGAGDNYENIRVDFARLEGFFTSDTDVSVRGGIIDGSCTAGNAATINTGQTRSAYAGTCDQFFSMGTETHLSGVRFFDNPGFGPTFKTGDILIEAGYQRDVRGSTQVIGNGVFSGGGNFEPQTVVWTSVTGATPNVLGLQNISPADTAPVTVTSFPGIAQGQDIYVNGGNSNVTLQNSFNLGTCSGANINLGSVLGLLHFRYLGNNIVRQVCG